MTIYPDDVVIWAPFNEREVKILATSIALEICKREEDALFGDVVI